MRDRNGLHQVPAFSPRAVLRRLRGFVTIPGTLSLSGLAVAALVRWIDSRIAEAHPALLPDLLIVSEDTSRSVLSTTATVAFSALVMVYSIVLLVYTLAAGSIGPRLLQRFGDDRVNQIAVGSLGATFLYCILALWLAREGAPMHLTTAVALCYVIVSVLLLLLFVHTVSARVTIDREAGEIARTFDRQLDDAIAAGGDASAGGSEDRSSDGRAVRASRPGYVDTLDAAPLVQPAAAAGAVISFAVRAGDFVMKDETLAHVSGDPHNTLDDAVRRAVPIIEARDPDGDLRFSVNLLVEIALRALSPGVNDTYTAIACVDRLSSSLARAYGGGLCVGVYRDKDGDIRVTAPAIDADLLFAEAFPPLRRAARSNGLMIAALTRALRRMARGAAPGGSDAITTELRRLREETEESDLLEADRQAASDAIEAALKDIEDAQGSAIRVTG